MNFHKKENCNSIFVDGEEIPRPPHLNINLNDKGRWRGWSAVDKKGSVEKLREIVTKWFIDYYKRPPALSAAIYTHVSSTTFNPLQFNYDNHFCTFSRGNHSTRIPFNTYHTLVLFPFLLFNLISRCDLITRGEGENATFKERNKIWTENQRNEKKRQATAVAGKEDRTIPRTRFKWRRWRVL